jgi:lipopolysaccharide export system protein LptA
MQRVAGKIKIASAGEPVTIGSGQNRMGAPMQYPPFRWRITMSKRSPEGRTRRPPQCRARLSAICLLVGFIFAGPALALPDDRDQPIRITADTAIRDEKQGYTVYTGNVHMIQGSLDIVADTLTIYHETEEADKIVAEGKPAKMQQRPAVDEPLVRARAEVIEYYKIEDRVHLKNDAYITRDDGSSVTGNTIDYFIAEQLVKADSEQTPDGKRVQVVIPSQVVREEEAADGATESN